MSYFLPSELINQISYSTKLRTGWLPSLTPLFVLGLRSSGGMESGFLRVQAPETQRPSGKASIMLVAIVSRHLG